jgi:lipopolysaccharide export LptBFGC system permease protein LptF
MLWTLWRAILIEFWRLLILSAGVLVTVVAFAATVKPLADGKLTADQAIRFMRFAIPPMLAYTLPFAGGFAATLAYHRFVVENEITAAHAGGVSHKKLLLPALASGLLLAGGLFYLNDRVIPRYLLSMEQMITRDFARLMVNSLRQGEAAQIGNTEIHADFVEEKPPEPGSPVKEQFLLLGVAMVETDSTGAVTIDGTAKRAWITLLPVWALGAADRARIGDQTDTAVILKFIDVTVYRDGAPQSADPLVPPAIPIASMFRDNPKFYSGAKLRTIAENPDSMSTVDRRRVALARIVAAYRSFSDFSAALAAGRAIVMNTPDGSTIRVLGSGMDTSSGRWAVSPLPETRRVEIEVTTREGRTDRLTAETARLSIQAPAEEDPLADRSAADASRFALDLTGVRVLGAGGAGTEIAETVYRDLWPAEDPMPEVLALDSPGLLALARAEHTAPESPVLQAARDLDREIDRIKRKALFKTHERWAMSASCVVMVVLGAVMAMQLKNATPLVIYLWSFFPALASIILLQSGQQMSGSAVAFGVVVMWSGVAGLGVLALLVFRRLSQL